MDTAEKKKGIDKKIIFAVALFAGGLVCFIINNRVEITMLLPAIALFIAGLFLLIKGGDWFVDGATAIAAKFKVPEVLIGATVVSIGTTLPEVMVSAQAAAKGSSAISYGNAIGSIICNTALICAVTLAIKPSAAKRKPLILPVCFFFGALIFYSVNAYVFGNFSRVTGIILLLCFACYMFFVIKQALKQIKEDRSSGGSAAEQSKDSEEDKEEKKAEMSMVTAIILLVFGAAIIAFGATLLVDNGTIIAKKVGVPESVIALTVVALGTSLPELVTAITSLIKGHGALSLGNIIGANLFNLVLVSGLAVTIHPFEVPSEKLIAGMNASLVVDIPMVFLVMMILTLPALLKEKLYRFQGILLLALYFGYMIFQFVF